MLSDTEESLTTHVMTLCWKTQREGGWVEQGVISSIVQQFCQRRCLGFTALQLLAFW